MWTGCIETNYCCNSCKYSSDSTGLWEKQSLSSLRILISKVRAHRKGFDQTLVHI